MIDRLDEIKFYQMSLTLFDDCWKDNEIMFQDLRGKEIAKQMTRSIGSICANIEEGYGRGFQKEYAHFLRISRGSARESKGWYKRSKFLLSEEIINARVAMLDSIIAMLSASISTLEKKHNQKQSI